MQYSRRNLLTCLVLMRWVIGRERNMSRSSIYNPVSTTLPKPMEKSFVSTEVWTEIEKQCSQLDCPIGRYWIIWLDGVDETSGLPRTSLLILPDSSVWEWDYTQVRLGVVGRRSLKECPWIRNLGAISVTT